MYESLRGSLWKVSLRLSTTTRIQEEEEEEGGRRKGPKEEERREESVQTVPVGLLRYIRGTMAESASNFLCTPPNATRQKPSYRHNTLLPSVLLRDPG
jgi:hypothetical protein